MKINLKNRLNTLSLTYYMLISMNRVFNFTHELFAYDFSGISAHKTPVDTRCI